jgi:cell division GTPase FtsZ
MADVHDMPDNLLEQTKRLRLRLEESVESAARIKVIGVGGGGGNAVNRMVRAGFDGVEFLVANTDLQALKTNAAGIKIQIGGKLTKGPRRRGGSERRPPGGARGHRQDHSGLDGADMIFVTTGLGGGHRDRRGAGHRQPRERTRRATVAVVTRPFKFEGRKRQLQAERGLDALRDCVDTIITIPNDRLLAIIDRSTPLTDAFATADDVLRQAIQGISDLILVPGLINLDFADVKTIMSGMGLAMMGTGVAEGETARSKPPGGRFQARCSKARQSTVRAASSSTSPADPTVARRSKRRLDHRPGSGARGRQHHFWRGRRSVSEGQGEDHGDRDRVRWPACRTLFARRSADASRHEQLRRGRARPRRAAGSGHHRAAPVVRAASDS